MNLTYYNTKTGRKEPLETIEEGHVKLYVCGITAYDYCHIGHARSALVFDMIVRYMRYRGLKVTYIRNFTDIDDKIIKRAQEQGTTSEELANRFIEKFNEDMAALGVDTPTMEPKATEHVGEIITMISELIDKGLAYQSGSDVYYKVEQFNNYGSLSGRNLEDMQAGARISINEEKENPMDFALWKGSKPGEPTWESPWGPGRPGWHIECSAMSRQALGQPFDIHTGGVDLIFPHHENEIAQSTAGREDPVYAKLFAHNEHLLVDGQKMSKSLNNFYTLQDIRKKGYDPLTFRMLVLQSHYRSQVNFSWTNLEAARNRLQDLRAMAALRWQARKVTHDTGTQALRDIPAGLAGILADDLDTPRALAYLSRAARQLLAVHVEEDMVDHFEAMLQGVDELLGLGLLDVVDITPDQKKLIAEREQARGRKDWHKSDKLRDELAGQGVGLHDHPHGVIWFPQASAG